MGTLPSPRLASALRPRPDRAAARCRDCLAICMKTNGRRDTWTCSHHWPDRAAATAVLQRTEKRARIHLRVQDAEYDHRPGLEPGEHDVLLKGGGAETNSD